MPGSVVTGADVVVGVGLVEVELGMGVVVVDGSILVVVLGVEVVLELLVDSVVVVWPDIAEKKKVCIDHYFHLEIKICLVQTAFQVTASH